MGLCGEKTKGTREKGGTSAFQVEKADEAKKRGRGGAMSPFQRWAGCHAGREERGGGR